MPQAIVGRKGEKKMAKNLFGIGELEPNESVVVEVPEAEFGNIHVVNESDVTLKQAEFKFLSDLIQKQAKELRGKGKELCRAEVFIARGGSGREQLKVALYTHQVGVDLCYQTPKGDFDWEYWFE